MPLEELRSLLNAAEMAAQQDRNWAVAAGLRRLSAVSHMHLDLTFPLDEAGPAEPTLVGNLTVSAAVQQMPLLEALWPDMCRHIEKAFLAESMYPVGITLATRPSGPRPEDWLIYVDESGQRVRSTRSSEHFTMSAVMFRAADSPRADQLLADLRSQRNGKDASFKKLPSHGKRVLSSRALGASSEFLRAVSVTHCKHAMTPTAKWADEHTIYYEVLGWLLERVSDVIALEGGLGHLTIAHVRGHRREQLDDALSVLRASYPKTAYLDEAVGFVADSSEPRLLIADRVSGPVFQAFETTDGVVESRYLSEQLPLYRCSQKHADLRGCGTRCLTNQTFKIWPAGAHRELHGSVRCPNMAMGRSCERPIGS